MTLLILFTSLLVLLIAICEDLRWFYRQNSGLDSTLWILTKKPITINSKIARLIAQILESQSVVQCNNPVSVTLQEPD